MGHGFHGYVKQPEGKWPGAQANTWNPVTKMGYHMGRQEDQKMHLQI